MRSIITALLFWNRGFDKNSLRANMWQFATYSFSVIQMTDKLIYKIVNKQIFFMRWLKHCWCRIEIFNKYICIIWNQLCERYCLQQQIRTNYFDQSWCWQWNDYLRKKQNIFQSRLLWRIKAQFLILFKYWRIFICVNFNSIKSIPNTICFVVWFLKIWKLDREFNSSNLCVEKSSKIHLMILTDWFHQSNYDICVWIFFSWFIKCIEMLFNQLILSRYNMQSIVEIDSKSFNSTNFKF